jgi:hypothetical protein
MNRRGTSVVFCFIAAFLFSTRYVAAAIFGSNVTSWNSDLFNAMLEYVGTPLVVASVISLIVGIAYLAWAEVKENDTN